MRRVIGYHGRCLDGATSAALMAALLDAREGPADTIAFEPLMHQQGNRYDPAVLDGDRNAVVDFKYSTSPRLHWWFDHHSSAFPDPAHREHFEARHSEQFVLSTEHASCARLIADTAAERWGLELIDAETLRWVDTVDSARFESAAQAVALEAPALQLMTYVENATHEQVNALVPRLLRESLADIVASPSVAEDLGPLLDRHRERVDLYGRHVELRGGVLFCDLTAHEVDGLNKFMGYARHPEAVYSVTVMRGPERSKVSVGSNPWRAEQRRHDIAALCEPHGGGGHAAVGAVTLPPGKVDQARQIALEIVQQLAGTTS